MQSTLLLPSHVVRSCRLIAGRRYAPSLTASSRHFHQSVLRYSESSPDPNGSSDPNSDTRNGVKPVGVNTQAPEHVKDSTESKESNQSSAGRKSYISGLRRTWKDRKSLSDDVPITATIPQWFVDTNVVTYAQAVDSTLPLQVHINQKQASSKQSIPTPSSSLPSDDVTNATQQSTSEVLNKESENENSSGEAPESTTIDSRYTISHDVWVRLKLSVRAGFATPSAKYANDPATEKSHLLLQYPHRRKEANVDVIGGSLFLHAVVQRLAKEEKADLVTLNAQDIARLCSEQARAEGKSSSSIRNLGYEIYNTWNKKRRLDMEPVSDKDDGPGDGSDTSISLSDSGVRPHIVPIEVSLPDTQLPNWLLSSFGASTDGTGPRVSRTEIGAWMRVIDQLTSLSFQAKPAATDSTSTPPTETVEKSDAPPKTIIHIQDYVELMHTREGSKFLKLLLDAIHSRRRHGYKILLVGTSSGYRDLYFDREMSPLPIVEQTRLYLDSSARPFASPIAVFPSMDPKELNLKFAEDRSSRIRNINIRHLQDMLRLRVDADTTVIDDSVFDTTSWPSDIDSCTPLYALNVDYLGYTRVHNLSSMIMGAVQPNEKLSFKHIRLAFMTETMHRRSCENWYSPSRSARPAVSGIDEKSELEEVFRPSKLDTISQLECNKYEKKLLGGVVDADNIRTTFSDVHVPSETVEALKTLTSLSLKRPDAFTYGVLASDKIPGMLLYGPPGTGKTLLAKAVARESGATVLEVSGSDIYDMYVGEGEKNVKAIFTLAKKLSPCVVFIDEADAIFGSRNQSRNRFSSHRELINQFLREWDGMNDMSAFIMVATNRPFDLDDAVLRRLPRRLLVDLPVEQDREAILKIHLKNEQLDPSVDLADLARRTPFYSGSDLKNVCVAAALTCVREEYEKKTQHTGDTPYQYPERRTLTQAHFERAMEEISASISEDMSSLDEIRKFDEKFGDSKGRRSKKASWGFMPLSDTQAPMDTPRVLTAEVKQKREAAVREAKQYVRDVVRVDWSYDPPSTLWTTGATSNSLTAETSSTSAGTHIRTELRQPNIAQWRIREPASSESDSDLDPALRKAIETHNRRKEDPYRFESPDAIKTSVLDRGRRRRADLEQEMKWNPGLRFYIERRDAWTGARKRRDVEQRSTSKQQAVIDILSKEMKNAKAVESDGDTSAKVESLDEAASSAQQSRDLLEDLSLSENKSRDTTTTTVDSNITPNDSSGLDGSTGDDGDIDGYDADRSYDSDESMIPVMESFIDNSNCVRSSITPALYASLYTKVVVQGLTPTIPINLSDVTKALVAGWKADGQWPPKPTIPPPGSDVPARKKGTKAQSSTKNDDATATGVVGRPPPTATTAGRRTSFSNQATSAVKKVLGLSGHSFHLRRSSRSSVNADSNVPDRLSSVADAVPTDVLMVEEEQDQDMKRAFGC
ncbi:mitochondrial AAA ATPase, putative [Talaromyces stipitatus ATCC 10500]|uniref:Mitochondrial AAA ATPase, putative n=1 Tax=Talaromyces stipitatus (strain ATCC 10500 / CBS 375.48 / QM 6759 / NRRL 1006) TaxID=441959 RepID=B8ML14_TALSN|nr:mitochondrial AAA ATPase, putative [Talaromyces stipitatus ATCC 10500]EED15430.1 mitochondrial AAA ATPase, putative [Talaromyces stipitatus ATCC 10500]